MHNKINKESYRFNDELFSMQGNTDEDFFIESTTFFISFIKISEHSVWSFLSFFNAALCETQTNYDYGGGGVA